MVRLRRWTVGKQLGAPVEFVTERQGGLDVIERALLASAVGPVQRTR